MKRINFSGRKILWMLFFPLTTIFMTDNAFAADPPQAEYEAALAEITDGSYYLVTEVNGTKFYITQNGYLTDDKEMAYLFDISKVNASSAKDKLFDVAFNIDPRNGAHFSNTSLINGKAVLSYGAYRQDRGNNRDDWERQIFYMNIEGKYAIRSCNVVYGESSWNDAGRAFWTWEIEDADAYYPIPCYSYEPAYIWSLEMPADSKNEIYMVLFGIYEIYENQVYDDVNNPSSVNMIMGNGPGYGQLADWETWRKFKSELERLEVLVWKFFDEDYNPLSDPNCPNLEGANAWKVKIDSMWQKIQDSEIPYKIPRDGYYRIMTRMRYYTDMDVKDEGTGEVIDIERSYADKALLASCDKNFPNEAMWGTLEKESANFIWKLTQKGDSILIQNVGMENYVSLESSDHLLLTTDNAQISHVVFDYAANAIIYLDNDDVERRDIFYIRLANQPRHSGRYVHQLDHNRGKDSHMNMELCFWKETYGYGEPYETDGGTSEWYLEPVSEEEAAKLAEKFTPIRDQAILIRQNQELRDKVHQAIFTNMLTATTLSSPHSDSLEGNINNLIDGNKSTFWHSDWHGEKPEGMHIGLVDEESGYHYLLLSGMEKMVGECELYLCQRNSKNDHPKTIYLFGSNDAYAADDVWTQMAVIEVPNVGPGEENTIPFTIENAYPYVRFVVTDCVGASYPFRVIWHAAEIQIVAKNDKFYFLGEIATNLERIYNENCAVTDEDVTTQLYEELEAAFKLYLNKIKETMSMSFIDANVKALCVSNWDINGDGELSYGESAIVKTLGGVFKGNTTIKSFDELQYFTNLTYIDEYAFNDCRGLTSISIPENVTKIGDFAFSGCNNLVDLYCYAIDIPSTGVDVFSDLLSVDDEITKKGVYNATLHVPHNSFHLYKITEPWCNFKNIVPITDEENTIIAGICGVNAFFSLNKSGVLAIEGIGPMSDYNYDFSIDKPTTPWASNREQIKKILIANGITSIGEWAFSDLINLTDVDLPNTVNTIGKQAFTYCYNLKSIRIPEHVTIIDEGVFAGCGLTSIILPNSVTDIAQGAFASCADLISLEIPTTVISIGASAFWGCYKLTTLNLPNSVSYINSAAFSGCTSLTSVYIPESVITIGIHAFDGCRRLTNITSNAVIPPVCGDDVFKGVNMLRCILSVPKESENAYRQAVQWRDFFNIKCNNDIYISQYIEYKDSLIGNDPLFASRPDIKLHYFSDDVNVRGHLTIDAGTTLSLGKFVQSANWGSKNDGSKYTKAGVEYYHPTTLQNDGFMRADSVIVKQSLYRDRWHFISFPFNVNVSEIKAPNGTYWALRRYDGEARATGQMNDTWQNLRQGEQMEAGCGYIIQLTREGADKTSELIFKAQNDPKKNNIFTTDDVTTPLEEHPSEFAHNRSWNLVGNPYPSFFDSRCLEQDGTIIVWNGNGYTAYSLVDDNYILMPFEAFFIQKPLNDNTLIFSKDGRQHTHEILPRAASRNRANSLQNRRILNFAISDGVDTDRSRVVINGQASIGYETDKDAPKFMEARPQIPQLFSVESGVQYAINERPIGDGQIVFSFYAPVDGEYHFSTDGDVTNMIVLDTETGTSWAMADGDYVFTATEGMHNARLVVSLTGKPTAIAQINAYDDGEIKVADGRLSLSFINDKYIKVFSLDGRLLYNDTTSHITINVTHGVYLIDIDGKTIKIMVK